MKMANRSLRIPERNAFSTKGQRPDRENATKIIRVLGPRGPKTHRTPTNPIFKLVAFIIVYSTQMRSPRMMGAKGKVSEGDRAFAKEFWSQATPGEKVTAIFELRDLYYEVMHPGTGAKRLDRSVGGTRRLRD